MSRVLLAIVLGSALAGCANGPQWVKPGTTAAARDADLMGCGSRTSHLQKDDPAAIAVVDRCMAARGYEKKLAE